MLISSRRALSAIGSIVVLAFTLTVAGCNSPAASDGTGTAADGGGSGANSNAGGGSDSKEYKKALKFVQCMREHGIDLEDPDSKGRIKIQIKANGEQFQAATEACRKYQPSGGGGLGGPGGGPPPQNMLDFAQCMRDNGVEKFPDPKKGTGMRIDRELAEDPDFESAQQKCTEKHLPDLSDDVPDLGDN